MRVHARGRSQIRRTAYGGEPPNGRYGTHARSILPVDPASVEGSRSSGTFRRRDRGAGAPGGAPEAASRAEVGPPATLIHMPRAAQMREDARRTIPLRSRDTDEVDGSRPSRPTPDEGGPTTWLTTPRTRRRRAGSS